MCFCQLSNHKPKVPLTPAALSTGRKRRCAASVLCWLLYQLPQAKTVCVGVLLSTKGSVAFLTVDSIRIQIIIFFGFITFRFIPRGDCIFARDTQH